MKISSGKWLAYKGRLFAILKSFDYSQLLEESKSQSATELLSYMKEQKIISFQAPVDYVLEDNLTITKIKENEMPTVEDKVKIGAVIGLIQLIDSGMRKIDNPSDEYPFEYWIESELSMIYDDEAMIRHIKKEVKELGENLSLLKKGIDSVYHLAEGKIKDVFDRAITMLPSMVERFENVSTSKEYLSFINENT